MPIQLEDNEQRVLGVLIEKSLTQQSSYPMTLNAIVLGANQKQNRDPVLALTEQDVGKALHGLQQRRLVAQADPASGARVNRFAHNVVERLEWDRHDQAVMAELMLRGHQTPGELRSRASRMTPFQDVQSVIGILSRLQEADPPFVEELPREPGRSANRFRHLIGVDAMAAAAPDGSDPQLPDPTEQRADVTTGTPVTTERPSVPTMPIDTSLAQRVAALEARVEVLERHLSDRNTACDDA